MEYSVIATTSEGHAIKLISESSEALDRIIEALEDYGFEYNESVDCWDEGFYDKQPSLSSAQRKE